MQLLSTSRISQADLLTASLRLIPKRIVVGEIRDPEPTAVLLNALNTGHGRGVEGARHSAGAHSQAAGVSAHHLLKNPKVAERIAELQGEVCSAEVADAIMSREERLERLTAKARTLDEIIAARAKDPEMLNVPGGSTGHLTKIWKSSGREMRAEFQLDAALLKELRATEQQISVELGEWLNRSAIEMRSDLPTVDIPENASLSQIRDARAKMQEALDVMMNRPKGSEVYPMNNELRLSQGEIPVVQSGDRWVAKASYAEKEVAKKAGFRWDAASKVWWATHETVARRMVAGDIVRGCRSETATAVPEREEISGCKSQRLRRAQCGYREGVPREFKLM